MKRNRNGTTTLIVALALVLSVVEAVQAQQSPYQLASATPRHSMQWDGGSYNSSTYSPQVQRWHDAEVTIIYEVTGEIRRANVRMSQLEQKMGSMEGRLIDVVDSQNRSIAELKGLKLTVSENTRLALRASAEASEANRQSAINLQLAESARAEAQASRADAYQANQTAQAATAEAAWARQQASNALAYARQADEAARPKGIGKLFALLIPGLRHQ